MKIPINNGVMGRIGMVQIIKHENENQILFQFIPEMFNRTESVLMTLDEAKRLVQEVHKLLESDEKIDRTEYSP